jgi:transcriptional regulator with XRE-family HTH domain
MSLGVRLRQERKRIGLTQEEFAALGGVKRVSQHFYEQDVRVPDMSYLMSLKAGGVDVWFLISGSRIQPATDGQLPRSVYVSAFRAVDELGRDTNGDALPLAERARNFDFLISLLQREPESVSLDEIKSRLAAALAA